MRIGIMGGTFNPIHHGHIISAMEVKDTLELDNVILIPSFRPPHKNNTQLADSTHRLEMAKIAVHSNPYLTISDIEIQRGGTSYSIETIRDLRERYGQGNDFFFIAGIDAFEDISTWKDRDLLLKLCNFAIITRPGYEIESISKILNESISRNHRDMVFNFVEDRAHPGCGIFETPASSNRIFTLHIVQIGISSTMIRKRIAEGKPISHLLPEKVAEYIDQFRLYESV